ncbi:hypothetical protein DC366_07080 [Pelagivirga sediminicola]|uniref:Uncharacterized protein n=1 Tax=Pelagivirga sediminicola TaxID=2170575 RepID=A0A2T7G889_9RHOB|nr:hypothetical protein [Pelagivirga sediminicola]PVA10643.1 hypothetical protein DC366_07080 [Pelagivirga sediminicola]
MQLVLHAGAHITDEDRLLKCLTANQDELAERGTQVPFPKEYRKLMRDVLHAAAQGAIAPDTREVLLDALGMQPEPDRLILSNPGFFGTPKMAASGGAFYTSAARRTQIFREIFANDEIEMFFAICNPATFLPTILAQTKFDSIGAYLGGTDPREMRWSDMIGQVREAIPNVPITVWCNEDTPLIWGQILREMAGVDHGVPLKGEHALLREIMTKAGMARFDAYLADHPGMTEMQKRRVISAFLDKFADQDAIEEELDLPGWTEELVDELSDLYDEDAYRIGRIPGISLITP